MCVGDGGGGGGGVCVCVCVCVCVGALSRNHVVSVRKQGKPRPLAHTQVAFLYKRNQQLMPKPQQMQLSDAFRQTATNTVGSSLKTQQTPSHALSDSIACYATTAVSGRRSPTGPCTSQARSASSVMSRDALPCRPHTNPFHASSRFGQPQTQPQKAMGTKDPKQPTTRHRNQAITLLPTLRRAC